MSFEKKLRSLHEDDYDRNRIKAVFDFIVSVFLGTVGDCMLDIDRGSIASIYLSIQRDID
jgi:hypothetical protein